MGLTQPLTYRGRTQTVAQWAAELGIGPDCLRQRLGRGFPLARALTPGKLPPLSRCLEHQGQRRSITGWAERLGIPAATICKRLERGHTVAEALSTVHLPRGQAQRERARRYSVGGEAHSIAEWAALTGIGADVIRSRLDKGWRVAEAVGRVQRNRAALVGRVLAHDGKRLNVEAWAQHLGVSSAVLYQRLCRGWTVARTLDTPVRGRP